MNKKNRILMVLGLLMVQTIVLSEAIDATREEELSFQEDNSITRKKTFDEVVEFKDNVTIDGALHVKGKTNFQGRIIDFDRLHVKENAHFDGVVHVDQNLDVEKNIICEGNIEAHNNINARHNITADNSAHIKNNLTVDGNLRAGNLVFTLSSTFVPFFSVCDLTVGCGLNVLPAATISIGGDLSIDGDISVGGDMSIGGDILVDGLASINSIVANDLSVGSFTLSGFGFDDGSLSLSGDLSIGTNLNLGYSTSSIGNINKGGVPFISNFGIDNTFVGANSGNFTTLGSSNTGMGTSALNQLVSGSDNTASGNGALNALTSGSFNVAFGSDAGSALVAGSNNIYVSNTGVAAESSTIRIGSGAQTRVFMSGVRGVTTGVNNAIPVLIDSNGQLGTISSSNRYKENIEKIDRAWLLSKLSGIMPVSFSYRNDPTRTKTYGMIAEELNEVMPELVIRDENGRPETIAYHLFTPLLIAMIQQLVDENKDLKEGMNRHEDRISRLEKRG